MAKYGPFFSYWSRDWELDIIDVIEKCEQAGASCTEIHS